MIGKKKEKVYPFNKFGLAQLKYDLKMEKINKISGTSTAIILIGFAAVGLMSKEFLGIYFIGKCIDTITDWII